MPLLFGAISSVLVGGSVGLLVWWVIQALGVEDLKQDEQWRYDVSRLNALRKNDPMFKLFQPIIQLFARLNRSAFASQLPEIARETQAAGFSRYWLPEEYLGKIQLISLMVSPLYVWICIQFMGAAGIVTAILMTGITVWLLRRRLNRLAHARLVEIKRRLPFLLDLMTLLMEAGSSFIQSLQQAVGEFRGHPVSQEFGRVLTDMNMGKARAEAFDNLRQRLRDDEINSIVGSILQSEELGTPLANIFRTQADILRLKRSQRAETIAGEAGVNMLLPGVLIMAATVLIILGPFLLRFALSGFIF
ncbi:MAG: type II secretion system F family protein [bacterium]|nr:type II secretion system F family protein [bacterium]